MIEVYSGAAQAWECDAMGHMNVRFYVARATDGLAALALALGLGPTWSRREGQALLARDHHIRFLREFRPGAPFRIFAGMLAVTDERLRVYFEFRNTATEEPAATFIAEAELVDLGTRAARPLPDEVKQRALALTLELPAHGRPRGLAIVPPRSAPDLARADALGLMATYQGVVAPEDCDGHGFMATPLYIARIAASVPNMVAMTRGIDRSGDTGTGGAALEYRLVYRADPRAGDILGLRSAIKSIGAKTYIWSHWLFDLETGAAVATSETVAITLDLVERRSIAIPDDMRAGLESRLVPGLGV